MIISQSSPSSRIVTGMSGLGILQSGLLVLRRKLKDSVSVPMHIVTSILIFLFSHILFSYGIYNLSYNVVSTLSFCTFKCGILDVC